MRRPRCVTQLYNFFFSLLEPKLQLGPFFVLHHLRTLLNEYIWAVIVEIFTSEVYTRFRLRLILNSFDLVIIRFLRRLKKITQIMMKTRPAELNPQIWGKALPERFPFILDGFWYKSIRPAELNPQIWGKALPERPPFILNKFWWKIPRGGGVIVADLLLNFEGWNYKGCPKNRETATKMIAKGNDCTKPCSLINFT